MFNWFCFTEAELKGSVSTETGLDNRLSELQRENTMYWVHWRPVQTAEQQDWTHRTLAQLQNYKQKLQTNTANNKQQRKHLFLFLHHLWFPHPLPYLQLVPNWSLIVQFSVTVSLIGC